MVLSPNYQLQKDFLQKSVEKKVVSEFGLLLRNGVKSPGNSQTILLRIVGKLSGDGSVPVAVGISDR